MQLLLAQTRGWLAEHLELVDPVGRVGNLAVVG